MAETLADVKYQVAVANRVLWALGLASGVTASLGHASLRVPGQPDRFVVKGRGYRTDASKEWEAITAAAVRAAIQEAK